LERTLLDPKTDEYVNYEQPKNHFPVEQGESMGGKKLMELCTSSLAVALGPF